ncbi:hypothetical protein XM53_00925 [Roseovarius atlanticus]|uniref:Uncharacterized protein n=1 Tax=Roseovarius atlanticus TaxID=1641875 RepID=A0A0T5NZK9_9RHOB|nr:hypothetical protein XM53_00925 [Roseovarius atlanticus]
MSEIADRLVFICILRIVYHFPGNVFLFFQLSDDAFAVIERSHEDLACLSIRTISASFSSTVVSRVDTSDFRSPLEFHSMT